MGTFVANIVRYPIILGVGMLVHTTGYGANWDNPKPADENDWVISLPGNDVGTEPLALAMRRVLVSGTNFWLDTNRSLVFGEDDRGSVYERTVGVNIMGSTRTENQWSIWIGKYETTVGQYAFVAGNGDLQKGLKAYAEDSGRGESYLASFKGDKKKRSLALAKPVDRLAPAYIQLFIRKLNTMCLSNAKCRETLPSVGPDSTIKGENYIPFFRLPTEIEWEYAARGVSIDSENYRGRLPVSASKIGNYANLDKVKSIGRKKPLHGFYDMFGNVSELVSGRMSEQIGGSHAGAWLAKGGKAVSAASKKPYTSQRQEVLEFEWLEEDSAPRSSLFNKVGFRLAIGAPLQAFDRMAARDLPSSDGRSLAAIDAIESLFEDVENRLASDPEIVKGLKSALERLRIDNTLRDVRSSKFIADNIHSKIVRVWTLRYQHSLLQKKLKIQMQRAESNRERIEKIEQRINYSIDQSKKLIKDYEEGLSALVAIPSIDASVVDSIEIGSYKDSTELAVMAVDAKKLLAEHIKNKLDNEIINLKKDIDETYPF